MTEFKYGNGRKAYLSAIIDLYDKSIVSYVLGHSNNNRLVFNTITPAIQGLGKDEFPLLHSDRSFQYTSKHFKGILEAAGMVHSMSRVGRCIDNRPIEAFWGTLKVEKYYLYKYETYEAVFCNEKIHSITTAFTQCCNLTWSLCEYEFKAMKPVISRAGFGRRRLSYSPLHVKQQRV